MIIGEFNDSFYPLMDGVAGVVLNYSTGLKKLGNEIHTVAGYGEPGYDEAKGWDFVTRIPVKRIPRFTAPYGILKPTKEIVDKLMSIDFDILHIHCPFYAGKLAVRIAKEKKIPIVGTFHSLFYDDIYAACHNSFLSRIITQRVMKTYYDCDEVWTPSSRAMMTLCDPKGRYKFTRDAFVMNNGCDFYPETNADVDNRRIISDRFSIPELADGSLQVLLYVGQLKSQKNLGLVLESLKLLKNEGRRFMMLFVGSGPQAEEYKSFVHDNGLDEYVKFLGRINDRSVLISLYRISYIFLFPSFYDTSCLVQREAACYNLPLVFGKGAATAEGIEDGVNGYLTENSAQSLSDVIAKALDNPDKNKEVGENAFKTLYKSWDEVCKEVEERYAKIIELHRG